MASDLIERTLRPINSFGGYFASMCYLRRRATLATVIKVQLAPVLAPFSYSVVCSFPLKNEVGGSVRQCEKDVNRVVDPVDSMTQSVRFKAKR
jgi:hypothetical protein